MISKIIKLKNIGLFHDATPNGALQFNKVTTIYAENGRGKSTFAAILRACQLGDNGRLNARKTIDGKGDPYVELLLSSGRSVKFAKNAWTTAIPDIVVFDSDFVEQNVYSGFEVRPDQRQSLLEFALGDQTVQLKKRIDELSSDIENQTRRRTNASTTLKALATPYNVSEFIALQAVPDADTQLDALRKRVEDAKNAQKLLSRKDPTKIDTIKFDIQAFFSVLKTQLSDVEETAENIVKEHLNKHRSHDFEDWISRGQQYMKGPDCPFCGQSVDGLGLVDAYRSYFNTAYSDLKQQITTLETLVTMGLDESKIQAALSAATTNTARIEAWSDQFIIGAPVFDGDNLAIKLGQFRKLLLTLAEKKQRSPLDCVGSEDDISATATFLTEITNIFNAYNLNVQDVVTQIADFRKMLEAENVKLLATEIQKLEATKKRMQPDAVEAVKEYQEAELQKKQLEDEKKKTRQQLDSIMNETLQQYQTSINDLLTKLGAQFSIEQLKPTYLGGGEPRSEYGLRVRNTPVKLGNRDDITSSHSFASTLSEADKRTLAFAFFVARLNRDEKLNDKLVVLDDPVSSLDRNRRYQSIRCIKDLASVCQQLIVLSHDAYFIREFIEQLDSLKPKIMSTVLTLKRVNNGYSAFAQCNIDEVCSSDYYRHHHLVADYVDGKSSAETRDVAKAIRPMLEGYYHRRFPGKIGRKQMFGEIINQVHNSLDGEPLAYLKPQLEEMDEVNNYARQFHHDTNSNFEQALIVDGELLAFAKRALALIYKNG